MAVHRCCANTQKRSFQQGIEQVYGPLQATTRRPRRTSPRTLALPRFVATQQAGTLSTSHHAGPRTHADIPFDPPLNHCCPRAGT
eukprot:2647281-Amphidinium_carterae.1